MARGPPAMYVLSVAMNALLAVLLCTRLLGDRERSHSLDLRKDGHGSALRAASAELHGITPCTTCATCSQAPAAAQAASVAAAAAEPAAAATAAAAAAAAAAVAPAATAAAEAAKAAAAAAAAAAAWPEVAGVLPASRPWLIIGLPTVPRVAATYLS